ncbi:MAG: tetratricopeptide repeat protein [Opitutus sp.]|nr:tetratricopeptide repeat protein [Opitutus sp.]
MGAFAYLCDYDWRTALAEYALAEPSLPNDAKLQYLSGLAHRRLGQWPEARRAFERAVVLNPRDVFAAVTLVETMHALRHFEDARTLAARNLAIFPTDSDVREFPSRAQFGLNGDVLARARSLAALGPTSGDPFGLRARLLVALMSGDFAGAERVAADPQATKLTSLNSALVEPVARSRALIAYVRGQREAAVKFADETIAFYRGQT